MTRIVISGFPPEIVEEMNTKLSVLNNQVTTMDLDDTFEKYQNVLPDMVLMDFSNPDKSADIMTKIVEFDSSACIFASLPKADERNKDMLYKSGVRVIRSPPRKSKMEAFIDQLYGACNDLEHEKCIGCWKTNRYDNLATLK